MSLRLAFKLGLGTLRSRPTLTLLAIGLLSLGTALLGGLFGTIYLLHELEAEFVSGLSVELELSPSLPDSTKQRVMDLADAWPGSEFVQFVPPEITLEEIQQETGEDLLNLFGDNPFPPLVRVRFSHVTPANVDSLSLIASDWPGVTAVSYPKRLWEDITRLLERLTGGLGYVAALLATLSVALVGLCLRAQVRNRAESWDFLNMLGMSSHTFSLTLFAQELWVGVVSGIFACVILFLLTLSYTYLFLRSVSFPFWFYGTVILLSILLALVAGKLSPRRIKSAF